MVDLLLQLSGNYLCIFTNLVSGDRYSFFKVNGALDPGGSTSNGQVVMVQEMVDAGTI